MEQVFHWLPASGSIGLAGCTATRRDPTAAASPMKISKARNVALHGRHQPQFDLQSNSSMAQGRLSPCRLSRVEQTHSPSEQDAGCLRLAALSVVGWAGASRRMTLA
jgi:hypothetical protein